MTGRIVAIVRAGADLPLLRRLEGVERTLLRGTAGTVALNATQMFLGFFVTLSLSRILGARGYGAYAYALAWSALLSVPAVLGITPLVVRNVAAYRERGEWGLLRGVLARANQAVLTSSVLLVVGGGLVAVAGHHSNTELLYPVLLALLLVPVVAITSIRQAAMQGLGRVVVGRMPETIVAPVLFLTLIVVTYGLISSAFSATTAIVLQVVAAAIALGIGAFLLRQMLPQRVKTDVPEHAMREWVRSAIPLLLFSLIEALNTQIEVILLGSIKGPAEAGLFSVAARVSGLVAFVVIAVGYPLSPVIARLHAAGDVSLLRRTVRRTARVVFLASLPLGIGVLALSGPLLGLFGAEFKAADLALTVLVLGQLGFAATGFAGTVLVMTGRESWLVRGVVVAAVTNVALNVLLIPPLGLTGAALGSTISLTAMNITLVYYARRRAAIPSSAFGL